MIHFLLNRVPTAYNSLLAGSFITVFVWNVSSSIQNWCLRFFAFRAKLIHVFVFFLLLCVVSCSFSLFLSFLLSQTFLFPPLSLFSLFFFFFCVDHCVARANLCRRRSVAFCPLFHSGPYQKRGEMHTHTRNRRTQRNIGNIVVEGDHTMVTGERKMHFNCFGCGW